MHRYHASQIENEQATACVHAALDAGISTFDTADAYANTQAETVLGEALSGAMGRPHVCLATVGSRVSPGAGQAG